MVYSSKMNSSVAAVSRLVLSAPLEKGALGTSHTYKWAS